LPSGIVFLKIATTSKRVIDDEIMTGYLASHTDINYDDLVLLSLQDIIEWG
jgi:hypothetical protein